MVKNALIFEKSIILRESDLCSNSGFVSLRKPFVIKAFKENKKPLNNFRDSVIRLGLEPKTYCLEGSCSIQLSYRTGLALFRFAGAKVTIFWQTAK